MVGKDLIRDAELRDILSTKEKFVTAVYTFKTKYNAIPGDMSDAQSYWGVAADCTLAQTTTATCNGTGNGFLDSSTPSGAIGNERFLFWKHLANAELISGKYTGITDGTTQWSATVNNSPSGKIANSLWYTSYWGTLSGSVWGFNAMYNNIFQFGLPVVNDNPTVGILTSKEMWTMDTKIDDGKPGTGSLRSFISNCVAKANGVTTAVATDTLTAVYRTSGTGNQCPLVFPNVF